MNLIITCLHWVFTIYSMNTMYQCKKFHWILAYKHLSLEYYATDKYTFVKTTSYWSILSCLYGMSDPYGFDTVCTFHQFHDDTYYIIIAHCSFISLNATYLIIYSASISTYAHCTCINIQYRSVKMTSFIMKIFSQLLAITPRYPWNRAAKKYGMDKENHK